MANKWDNDNADFAKLLMHEIPSHILKTLEIIQISNLSYNVGFIDMGLGLSIFFHMSHLGS